MATATLDGIVYITKADYDNLKANGTATICGHPQTYDANKIYIIKEELATEVTAATASGNLSNQPATTNAIWAAILNASGSTYTLNSVANEKAFVLHDGKADSDVSKISFASATGGNITITSSQTDANHVTFTFSSTYINTTYSLSSSSAGTTTSPDGAFTSSVGYLIDSNKAWYQWIVNNVARSASTGAIDVAPTSTCADYYLFFAGKSGTPDASSSVSYNTDLKYNPNAKILYSTNFYGALTGKATTAGTADKVAHNLTISLNGAPGATYDGSVVSSVNITPLAIGAAPSSHTHTSDQISDRVTTSAQIVSGGTGLTDANSVYQFVTGQITQIHNFMGDITPATMTSAITASSDGKYYVGTHQLINGDVYNVNSAFVIPGSSSPTYQAGMNVAWVSATHNWDALGGAYTLSLSTDATGSAVQINYGGATTSININNVNHASTASNAEYASNVGTQGTQGTAYLSATQIINALTITYLV